MPVPSPREKVDGMADAIKIARGLWTESTFSIVPADGPDRATQIERIAKEVLPAVRSAA
jgi:hypothetical protein